MYPSGFCWFYSKTHNLSLSLSLSLSIKRSNISSSDQTILTCLGNTLKPQKLIMWWIEPWTFGFMSCAKPISTHSKYYHGRDLVWTEKRMFLMMMWIRLSNNQTVEIELFHFRSRRKFFQVCFKYEFFYCF